MLKQTRLIASLLVLILAGAVSAQQPCRLGHTDDKGVFTCLDKPDDTPARWELFQRIAVDGAQPFTLRGWRVDFTQTSRLDWDDFVGAYDSWDVRVSSGQHKEVWHYKISRSFRNSYSLTLNSAPSTEALPGPPTLDNARRTVETKPSFGVWEISKGAYLRRSNSPSFGGSGIGIDLDLQDGRGSWTYTLFQDADGTLRLVPGKMTRTTYRADPKNGKPK